MSLILNADAEEQLIAMVATGDPDGSDNAGENEESGSDIDVQVLENDGRPKLKEPLRYAVLLLNDDYTSMEFVVDVLQRFFRKSRQEATQIMLRVHQEGKGLAGVYVFEIAETKVAQVHEYARAHGFPLRCTLEPLL